MLNVLSNLSTDYTDHLGADVSANILQCVARNAVNVSDSDPIHYLRIDVLDKRVHNSIESV